MKLAFDFQLHNWGAPDKATLRALNKAGGDAARAMRVESSRQVRARKRFKVKRVNKSLTVVFPRNKTELTWTMHVSGKPTPVGEMTPRQTKKGVTFGINKGKRSLLKGAFLATMRSGHKGVYYRKGKARLPIREVFTTRVSDVFRDGGFVPGVYRHTEAVFAKSFARLLPLEMAKGGSKRKVR